ncbi:MAG: type II secretion system F family protein [Chloroflexi bacterium]|nr:MAG: type II secretion system F family protein [Chloroflexota bacterium]TMD82504.1 MAG: type II secretion system F family protein [Chloroflexota bacterium]
MMPSYAYRAYTEKGQRREGRIDAEGTSAAEQALWLEGLKIVALHPAPAKKTMADYFPSLYRISRADIILFTRQLATFVGAGVPMTRALGTMAQEASPLFKRVILSVLDDLERGQNLSEALLKHPKVFPTLYIDLIRVAELTGNLEATLTELAGYLRRDLNTARRVQAAMIYPAVILVVATGVVIILVFFALPAFVRIFAEFRVELPLSTRILIGIVNFTRQWALVIGAVILAGAGGIVVALRTSRGAYAKDQISIKAPILGPIVLSAVLNRFARTLAMVLKAGVPLGQTFEAVIASTGNKVFQRGLTTVKEQMTSGEGFAGPLIRTHLFPPMLTQMVRVGEETGTLDTYLEQAAEFYEEELEYRIRAMTSLIEPVMTVAVGVIVGFIAISLISAMYGLVGALK